MAVLGFNSNLHAAETVAEIEAGVLDLARAVRVGLGWPQVGLDLRLGQVAIAELQADARVLAGLRAACDRAGVVVTSINAFPLQSFQAAVVKERAYEPDWSEPLRRHLTMALIPIAAALVPGEVVCISTVPGGFRPAINGPGALTTLAVHLVEWAVAAWRFRQEGGPRVVLCVEPEPWCLLERGADVRALWRQLAQAGLAAASARLGDERAAQAVIAEHLGVCYDTCHASVMGEDPVTLIGELRQAGIPLPKVQVSAAPEVRDPAGDAAGVAALCALAEPRFLHQASLRSACGSQWWCRDLDELPRGLRALPDAVWARSHFHTPLFQPTRSQGLSSTIGETLTALPLLVGAAAIAVETYTWSVLGDAAEAVQGTIRELEWLADQTTAL